MTLEQDRDRHGGRRLAVQRLAEGRSLRNPQPHPQTQADQHGARHERNAPAPGPEIRIREEQAEQKEQPVRRQKAHRRAELRGRTEPCFPPLRGIFHRQQRCPAPFAAQPETLAKAQDAQEQRRDPADHRIGRQKGDQQGGNTHQHQRGDQRRLAPDPVAVMAEHDRADGPGKKGQPKAHEGEHRLRRRAFRGKEQRTKHQRRRRGVDVEVIEFDRRAGKRGGQDAGVLANRMHGRIWLRPIALKSNEKGAGPGTSPGRRPSRVSRGTSSGYTPPGLRQLSCRFLVQTG